MRSLKTKKNILTAAAVVFTVAAVVFAMSLVGMTRLSAAAEEQPVWTPNANWTVTEENGETVYTHATPDPGAGDSITYSAPLTGYDYISMDMNANGAEASDGPNFGISLRNENNNEWFMDYDPRGNVRIRYNGNFIWVDGSPVVAQITDDHQTFNRKWFNFKVEMLGNTIGIAIDGETKLSYTNTDAAASFDKVTVVISSWRIAGSAKNLTVKKREYDAPGVAWSGSKENGESVYTHLRDDPDMITKADGNGTYNTFSADVRLNNDPSALGDGNMSLSVRLNATDLYMFEYNPAPSRSYARLRYFDADHAAEGTELGKSSITVAHKDEWINLKAVFERDYLSFYIDGKRVISHFETGNADFSSAQGSVSMWLIQGSVKNITAENTDKDYDGVSYVDLEFKKALSAEVFTAQNGEVSWDERGALDLAVTGADPVLTSPLIDVPQGSAYSAKLSVRNTLCVRLKNGTAADKLTLNYITAADGVYDGVKQKTFGILPDSDYTTYYFNISDVADCGHWETNAKLKACNCYLRGFKFTFDGATSGSISVDAITFEREDRIWEKAASSLSCVADKEKKTVTVSGTLLAKYAGKTVKVYETSIKNYNELLSYADNIKLAEGVADGEGNFTVVFPLVRETGVSHMATVFLAEVDGHKLGDAFMIENWHDFTENPYAFELNDITVDVTTAPYNAKGDGFTNDNAAIQAAVDYVSAQGGGTVRLPGDTSDPYGRRYIATQITLKDNVELNIEKGAVLWQSQRLEEYVYAGYAPVYGHDIVIQGVPWTHAAASWNLPFIYANEVSRVRVTGGGEIRMQDTGSQWLDGNGYAWDSDITVHCGSVIHLHPFASHKSTDVEVSDITVKRGNIWHMPNENSSRLYFGNVTMTEITCINADGLSFGYGTHDVYIDRCTLYSNDDAIVLSAFYDDPRGHTEHSWWEADPGDKFTGIANFSINRSNMFGGHGITFITWGSDSPDAENVEIKNISVTDNILGGSSTAVGCWTDNPFYGSSNMSTYDQCEKNDYSPVKELYIKNNIYTSPTLLGTWDGDPPELALATDAITDCGIVSPGNFVNGSFDKTLRYDSERTWTTGLSYWSNKLGDGGEVGTKKTGTKLSQVGNTQEKLETDDYAAFVKGNAELYQGLYNTFGAYRFSVKVMLVSGTAKLFARDAVTGETIAEKTLTASDVFTDETLDIVLERGTTVRIGISHTGEATDAVYIDDADLSWTVDPDIFEVGGEKHVFGFDNTNGFTSYSPSGLAANVNNGILTVPAEHEYKIMLDQIGKLEEFDVGVDILITGGLSVNAGLYIGASNVRYTADKIDAYNIQLEYEPGNDCYSISVYKFSSVNGYMGRVTGRSGLTFADGDMTNRTVRLRAVVKSNTLFVFTEGNDEFVLSYELPSDYTPGNVGLRSQCRLTRFDDFYVTSPQYADVPGNRSELNKAVSFAEKFTAVAYTEESFARLTEAIAQADALGANATQTEIDRVLAMVNAAVNGLVQTAPPTVAADKTGLNMLVGAAKRFDAEMYTSESYKRLETALTAAERVSADGDATEEEITAAIDGINGALSLLVKADRAVETETKTVTDTGMTVAFYVTLGLLITVVAAVGALALVKKKNGKTKEGDGK